MNSMRGSIPERGRPGLLHPAWPAGDRVRALSTLREGGFSRGAWGMTGGAPGGWNVGTRCGDDPDDVLRNRSRLRELVPAEPLWLEQVHGVEVLDADEVEPGAVAPVADAAVASRAGRVLVIQTADCLPVMLTNRSSTAIGIAHAGWRGLRSGILEATVASLAPKTEDHDWIAWLGPAIGACCFEVGDDVRDAFVGIDPHWGRHFAPTVRPGKWLGDLTGLARRRLGAAGVSSIHSEDACTVCDPRRFFSFRRDRETGRMASLIWLA